MAIFCKTSVAPIRAEEGTINRVIMTIVYGISIVGLAGKLHSNLEDSLAGEYLSIDENDLVAIDREGRAIMTEHELE